jgi:hypothetical protein
MSGYLSAAHIDYLQRTEVGLAEPKGAFTTSPVALRRLWRVNGIGRTEKEPAIAGEHTRFTSEDVLISLYGGKIPLAFILREEPEGIAVYIGTWSPDCRESAPSAVLDARSEILKSSLASLYPAVDLSDATPVLPLLQRSGLVLGIPSAKSSDPLDRTLPIDRLLRALSGTDCFCLILAEPIAETTLSDIRSSVINETRSVETGAQSEQAPSPLAEHYLQLLKVSLGALTEGLSVGAWRTTVYLAASADSYDRLASIWSGVFGGSQSLPEPVRVLDGADVELDVARLASLWAMPDSEGMSGPGLYRHPFQFQTLLTSSQLSCYVHLPQLETPGFSVRLIPSFDSVPQPTKADDALHVGRVIHRGTETQSDYSVTLRSLDPARIRAGRDRLW